MGTVANLAVKIGANTQDLNDKLDQVKKRVESVDAVLRQTEMAREAFAGINNAVAGMKALADQASRIQDLAMRTGLTAEAVQRLDFAAKQSGTSFETMQNAMRAMATNIVEGDIPAQLERMGLTAEKLRGMSLDQAFLAIGNAAMTIKDPMEQMAVFSEIFGARVGVQLIAPFRDGMAQIAAQAPLMSNSVIAALDGMGDKWLQTELQLNALRANALAPLVETLMSLPQGLQTAVVGFTQLLPFVESLTIAVIALGGPGKALALFMGAMASIGGATITLGTTIGGFLTGAGATLATFFTTTLPAAFGAVISFLGPQGLIAVAILALAGIWYMWGDDIKKFMGPWVKSISGFFLNLKNEAVAYAQQLFTGVRDWLVNKFNAIVDSIRQKINQVKEFFKGLYMDVVGGSYVPDMIRGIGAEFGKLDSLMVGPTRAATSTVAGLFQSMLDSVSRSLDGLISKIPGVGGILSDIFGSMGGLGGILSKIPGLGGLLGGAAGTAGGGILGGLLGGAAGGPLGLAATGIMAAAPLIGKGLQWMFDAGPADLSSGIFSQMRAANGITDMPSFVTETDAASAQGVTVNVAVNAVDAQGVSELVESDAFTQSLIDAFRRNRGGLLTAMDGFIGVG